MVATFIGSFALFCCGTTLLGAYQGFALYYRFAAADTATPEFRPKAISLVMAGGIAAALFGPETAKWSRTLFEPVLFAGCYLVIVGLCLAACLLVQLVRIPRPATVSFRGGRPMSEIARQPGFVVAAGSAMLAYGVMVLVMTATPLAMLECNLSFAEAAFVIQWHALGMYAPSFVTGHLIAKFGVSRIMAAGALLLAICIAVDVSGVSLAHFWLGLMLLGIGWNFLFVGASTLLTHTYRPEERAKVQAANDFLVFGMVSISSFSSGALLGNFGWLWVNLAVTPLILGAFLIVTAQRRQAAVPAQ
jgi:hypothetical protein